MVNIFESRQFPLDRGLWHSITRHSWIKQSLVSCINVNNLVNVYNQRMPYLIYVLACLCCGFVCDGNHKVLAGNGTNELASYQGERGPQSGFLQPPDIRPGEMRFHVPTLLSLSQLYLGEKNPKQNQHIKCKV